MARLSWDDRDYEMGLDRGVVYPANGLAEVWNGLASVNETPSNIRERVRYRDGRKIVNQRAEDSFSASITALAYPEIAANPRVSFDMTYRVKTAKGYKIHLVYNAIARMRNQVYTQNGPAPISFDIGTTPLAIPGMKPSAHLIIDTGVAISRPVLALEDVLYGTEVTDARLPLPKEVFDIFEANTMADL